MAKRGRPRKKKNLLKKIFGDKFDKWDVLLLLILILAGYFIFIEEGLSGLFKNVIKSVFFTLFATLIIKQLLKRAKR